MLLGITCTSPPATGLGWLLHNNPERVRSLDLPFGHTARRIPETVEQSQIVLIEPGPAGSHQSISSLFRSTVQLRRAGYRRACSG